MKTSKVIFWITSGFLFLFEGVMPVTTWIFAPDVATSGAVALGFPAYFAYILIVFKALGAIALIIPKLPRQIKEWAYAGLAFNFICASISHFVVDGSQFVSFFPLIILAILIVSYFHYFRIYNRWEGQITH
jgi:uncharacterized membrane protein YphA (DoxX/SURF4 family)